MRLDVFHTLGHGFLETAYKKAMLRHFETIGLKAAQEVFFRINYLGSNVIVELKAVGPLVASHRAQLLNHLKASRLPVGLLLNFGSPRLEIKRVLL